MNKPLKDWTLEEVKKECARMHSFDAPGGCKDCLFYNLPICETYSAFSWDLSEPPRFTEAAVRGQKTLIFSGRVRAVIKGGQQMLNELAKEIHQNAVDHGWWDGEERSFPEIIALCHSELSEALEEYRGGRPNVYCSMVNTDGKCCSWDGNKALGVNPCKGLECDVIKSGQKPEGIPIELADCIIRILDYCGKEGIDIDEAIRVKHEFNKTRPWKHGGKVL